MLKTTLMSAAGVALMGICITPHISVAQESQHQETTRIWMHTDALLGSERVSSVWKRRYTAPPMKKVDLAEVQARAHQQILDSGGTEEQAQEYAKATVDNLNVIKGGFTRTDALKVTRVGKKAEVEVVGKDNSPAGGTTLIDVYDGVNAISLTKDKDLVTGDLSRAQSRILDHSFSRPVDRVVFLGAPLSTLFPPTDSQVKRQDETLQISQFTNEGVDEALYPHQDTLTLSQESGLPLSFVRVNTISKRPVYSYTFTNWKKIGESCWLPEKVVVEGAAKVEYDLVEARCGATVDPADLKLPPRIDFTDARFGAGKAVTYVLRDGEIPTDAQVEKLLGEKTQEKVEKTAQETASHTPLLLLGGLGLLGIGGVVWKKGASAV